MRSSIPHESVIERPCASASAASASNPSGASFTAMPSPSPTVPRAYGTPMASQRSTSIARASRASPSVRPSAVLASTTHASPGPTFASAIWFWLDSSGSSQSMLGTASQLNEAGYSSVASAAASIFASGSIGASIEEMA